MIYIKFIFICINININLLQYKILLLGARMYQTVNFVRRCQERYGFPRQEVYAKDMLLLALIILLPTALFLMQVTSHSLADCWIFLLSTAGTITSTARHHAPLSLSIKRW